MTSQRTIVEIERAFASAWPALETQEDGAWQARFSRGLTRRANAIQCMDPNDDADAARRIGALSAGYGEHGLTPTFRVTPLTGRGTFAALGELGWAVCDQSLVLESPLAHTNGMGRQISVLDPLDDEFIAIQTRMQPLAGEEGTIFADILKALAVPAAGLVLYNDETPCASLLCAEVNGIGVFLNVITAPTQRRAGHGRKLMDAGLSWVAENGARSAALQVACANSAAVSLYLSLGFAYRYPYHYCRALSQ